jgi:hypothetical protein
MHLNAVLPFHVILLWEEVVVNVSKQWVWISISRNSTTPSANEEVDLLTKPSPSTTLHVCPPTPSISFNAVASVPHLSPGHDEVKKTDSVPENQAYLL